jgi:electron transfer flavoprotein alpha subunit
VNGGNASELGAYGAAKVLEVSNDKLQNFNAEAYADVIAQAAKKEGAEVVVLTSSANSKFMAPLPRTSSPRSTSRPRSTPRG